MADNDVLEERRRFLNVYDGCREDEDASSSASEVDDEDPEQAAPPVRLTSVEHAIQRIEAQYTAQCSAPEERYRVFLDAVGLRLMVADIDQDITGAVRNTRLRYAQPRVTITICGYRQFHATINYINGGVNVGRREMDQLISRYNKARTTIAMPKLRIVDGVPQQYLTAEFGAPLPQPRAQT